MNSPMTDQPLRNIELITDYAVRGTALALKNL